MSVGGVLGVGAGPVAVRWSEITFGRDDKSVTLTTALTKDALNAMADYTSERRQAAPAETANAPPGGRCPGQGGGFVCALLAAHEKDARDVLFATTAKTEQSQ